MRRPLAPPSKSQCSNAGEGGSVQARRGEIWLQPAGQACGRWRSPQLHPERQEGLSHGPMETEKVGEGYWDGGFFQASVQHEQDLGAEKL